MKKYATWLLYATLLMTAIFVVGCGSVSHSSATANKPVPTPTDTKTLQTVFASALIADSLVDEQFNKRQGLAGGKVTTWYVPIDTEQNSIDVLSNQFWDKNVVKAQYEYYLGNQTMLDQANAEFKAKSDADYATLSAADKKNFVYKPAKAVADPAKYMTNNLHDAKANFADAQITAANGTYTIQCKGLTYVMKQNGNAYEVISKTGHLSS